MKRYLRVLVRAIIFGIAFAFLATGIRALFGLGDLLLVAWWVGIASTVGFLNGTVWTSLYREKATG